MDHGDHRTLIVWQKAMDLVVSVYKVIDEFPNHEKYALCDQLRRAVVSIPSNIAEGRRRGTEKEFKHFLRIAFGSSAEVETQLDIALRLSYITEDQLISSRANLEEVMRMLNKMSQV